MKKTELQTMVVTELKALAKKMNVKMPSKARKSDIVDLLSAAFKKKNGKDDTLKSAATNNGVRKNSIATTKRATVEKKASKPAPVKPVVEPISGGREWKVPPAAHEPLMAQERVADAKYYTGHEKEPRTSYRELPTGYGEEKISLIVKDPYIAYAYWEVRPSRIEREKAWFGWNGKLMLRVYDVTGVHFDGRNALGYYDQEVNELIGSWYFDLGRPSHSFIADIGLSSPEGRFLTLARSNYVMMPRDAVADVVDEQWMLADEEFWKLYGFPGGPSSGHLQEMLKARRGHHVSSPSSLSRSPKRK